MPACKTILIAEDCQDDFILLDTAFRRAHSTHRTVRVHDGEAALDYIQGKGGFTDRSRWPAPDLVILDIKMPKASGFDVLEELQRNPGVKAPIAIVLSGSIIREDAAKALALGAAEYFTKPTGIDDLLTLVSTIHEKWLA